MKSFYLMIDPLIERAEKVKATIEATKAATIPMMAHILFTLWALFSPVDMICISSEQSNLYERLKKIAWRGEKLKVARITIAQ